MGQIFVTFLKYLNFKKSKKNAKTKFPVTMSCCMYYEISCFRKLLAGLLIDVGYKKFALFAIEKR